MRLIKCRDCGKEFDATEYQYLCQDCAKKARSSSVLRDRICKICGSVFVGYPRSQLCPACQRAAKKESSRRAKARKRAGVTRKIGSSGKCVVCGAEYIVNSARQKYCPDCAQAAVSAVTRAHKRAYNRGVGAASVATAKCAAQARKICVVCGMPVPPGSPRVTCSDACAKEHKRQCDRVASAKQREKDRGK